MIHGGSFWAPAYHSPMARTTSPTPGTTSRTRRAILDAALTVLTEDSHASLSDIAKAAEVGRSTLHRYFPDRAALIKGLNEDTDQATRRAFEEAELTQGTPAEAFRRLVHAMYEVAPRVHLLFNETQFGGELEGDEDWDDARWEKTHWPVGELFHRGQREGYFDAEIDDDWFVRMLWYALSGGWEAVTEGKLSKHQAIALTIRLLEGGVVRRDS